MMKGLAPYNMAPGIKILVGYKNRFHYHYTVILKYISEQASFHVELC